MKTPEMGSPQNEKKNDSENVVWKGNVAYVKDFEKEKFAHTKAHSSEIPEGGAEVVRTFEQRKDSREGAANIARQLLQKQQVPPQPGYITVDGKVEREKLFGLPRIMQRIRAGFGSTLVPDKPGVTFKDLSAIDASELARASRGEVVVGNPNTWSKSEDPIDRVLSREETAVADMSRYVEGISRACSEIEMLLNTKYQNIDTGLMQEEVRMAAQKIVEWRKLLKELQEVHDEERGSIPFYKKSIEEAFGDASDLARRLSLRKFK